MRGRLAAVEAELQVAKAFFDQCAEAVVVHDMDGTIRSWSAGAERLFGYTREQASGNTYAQLLGPQAALSDEHSATLGEHGTWLGEMTCIHAAGHAVRVERHCRVVRLPGAADVVFTFNSELGERHRAEKESVLVKNLLEQRLKAQTAQLTETTEEMRDISYSIAHDLRAPLTAIRGFSTQLQRRLAAHLDEGTRHWFARLDLGAQALTDMTCALETLARLSHTKLRPQRIDIAAVATNVFEEMRNHGTARRVSFAAAEMPPAIADLGLVRNLLEQLLGNAWKFTAAVPEARISIEAQVADNGACVYCVRDNGVGFDPEYAYKLFAPFQRLHSPEEFPGTGMGLALARKIVSRHRGRIWAQSSHAGGTSVFFTFHDPAVAQAAAMQRVKIAEDQAGPWTVGDAGRASRQAGRPPF